MKKTALVLGSLVLISFGLVVSGVGGDLFFKAFLAYGKPAVPTMPLLLPIMA